MGRLSRMWFSVLVSVCFPWGVGTAFGQSAMQPGAEPAEAQPVPPEPEPRWWKGNLHTHTFWSDGNDFPEMVADWYRRHGYNFLAISDHNVMNEGERWMPAAEIEVRSRGSAFEKYLERFGEDWVETRGSRENGDLEVRLKPMSEYRSLFEEAGRFLMIPAEEITGSAEDGNAIHMNATNLVELIEPQPGATVSDAIRGNLRMAREQADRLGREILVHVNHPNFRWGVTPEDLAAVEEERFFEVWNGVDGDNDPGNAKRPSTDEMWDIANTLRLRDRGAAPLYGLATDDAHDYHLHSMRAMPGRAWIMVWARHLTPESIISAIRDGAFYASTGVTYERVEFDKQSGRLSLEIEPEDSETYVTRFIGTRRVGDGEKAEVGEVLARVEGTRASFTLSGDEWYVRAVTTSDAAPDRPSRESLVKRAWTQPVGWKRWIQRDDMNGERK